MFDSAVHFGSLGLQVLFHVMTFACIMALRNEVTTPAIRKTQWQEIKLYIFNASVME